MIKNKQIDTARNYGIFYERMKKQKIDCRTVEDGNELVKKLGIFSKELNDIFKSGKVGDILTFAPEDEIRTVDN